MKNLKISFIVFVSAMAISCNQNKVNSTDKEAEYPTTDPLLNTVNLDKNKETDSLGVDLKCYLAHIKKDSAFLSLRKNGNTITGSLEYKFDKKENSKGDLKGSMMNDTIKVTYTPASSSEKALLFIYDKGHIYELHDGNRAQKDLGFIYIPTDCR